MPLQETSGTASYDAFGGGIVAEPNYIESCFSTWLYTGNGSTQTITNGIDLSTKGGLVWMKGRTATGLSGDNHGLFDTARGGTQWLRSNGTNAQTTVSYGVTFGATGFTALDAAGDGWNANLAPFVSWTFRKQPKFFDVVTYTGNGTAQNIAHSLGSVPGCIIVKSTSTVNDWRVYHRSLATVDSALRLNSTAAAGSSSTFWNSTAPTSTQFTVGSDGSVNANGATYVAYLFAHDAGGFGLTGTDNVISCGSFTTDAGGAYSVSLGYEPQWVMIKRTDSTQNWLMFDNMRGLGVAGNSRSLFPNLSDAESGTNNFCAINATGFTGVVNASASYIYIAIRRGPMKTPTSGTSVFSPVNYGGNGTSGRQITSPSFPTDLMIGMVQNQVQRKFFWDRLRGASVAVDSTTTDAEYSTGTALSLTTTQNGFVVTDNGASYTNWSGYNYDSLCFRRAPGFFDEVCYTGTGSATTFNHNLGVVPELMIIKDRTVGEDWTIYSQTLATNQALKFTTAAREQLANYWNTTRPTSSVFSVGDYAGVNSSGDKYVAYLFASCPGVSKVGSYTGTGATQTISCGFAARFVMIKRTDSTGSWWVWDTARGMVAGTDPRLALNSTAAESNANWVYTDASGFQIVTTDATVNASGGSYIFLAVG